jgi:cysteine desulfurase
LRLGFATLSQPAQEPIFRCYLLHVYLSRCNLTQDMCSQGREFVRGRWPLASQLRRWQTLGCVIYFDHNATTPLTAPARAAWLRAQDEAWVNPASPYREAARVRIRLEAARETLGSLLGAAADRVVHLSGATEAAAAIASHLARTLPVESRVALNPTEHPCVLAAFGAAFPGRSVALPLTAQGRVEPERVVAMVQEAAASATPIGAIVVMAANNETGVLQPWSELARVCRALQVAYVCDASQWLGKLPAAGLGAADWVLASAHKLGGPKGVGFLLRASSAGGFQGLVGGGQQRGHRSGTEDYPGVAALVAALVEAESSQVLWEAERAAWRDAFEHTLLATLPGAQVVAAGAERLWNTVSLTLPRHEHLRWVARLDKRGFAVSTGSACATGREGPSHVLAALGLDPEAMRRTIRISAGWSTRESDWLELRQALVTVGAELDAEPTK